MKPISYLELPSVPPTYPDYGILSQLFSNLSSHLLFLPIRAKPSVCPSSIEPTDKPSLQNRNRLSIRQTPPPLFRLSSLRIFHRRTYCRWFSLSSRLIYKTTYIPWSAASSNPTFYAVTIPSSLPATCNPTYIPSIAPSIPSTLANPSIFGPTVNPIY